MIGLFAPNVALLSPTWISGTPRSYRTVVANGHVVIALVVCVDMQVLDPHPEGGIRVCDCGSDLRSE
jgi:hypothetical protein